MSHSRSIWLAALAFTLLGFLVYANTLQAPFILDDNENIARNAAIRMKSFSGPAVWRAITESPLKHRPLASLSFALNYLAHRYSLPGYHLTNIAIHILTGILLFLLLRKTLVLAAKKDDGSMSAVALWAALLWLVHPLQTQSVTYTVQRMTSMAAMFSLLALLLYAGGRTMTGSGRRLACFVGSAVSGLAALGSKETSAILPLLILLYEWYFLQRRDPAWLQRRLPVLAGVMIAMALLALFFLGPHPLATIHDGYARRPFTLDERLLTEARVVLFYLSLLLLPLPSRLSLDHDFPLSHSLLAPPTTAAAILFLLLMLLTAVRTARRQPLLSFAIVWFLANLIIESTVIPLELVFEHRLYLPSMFLFLLPVLGARHVIASAKARHLLLAVVTLLLCLGTSQRNAVWTDRVTFWTDSVHKSPNKARPHDHLGLAYYDLRQYERAVPEFLAALRIDPADVDAHYNLGNILLLTGRYPEAVQRYNVVLLLTPDDADAHNNLGYALERLDRRAEALHQYRRALELDPNHAEARRNHTRLAGPPHR